jgi:hypothetical protein
MYQLWTPVRSLAYHSHAQEPPPDVVSVQIAHLKSYEGMGQAALTCSGGCQCQRTVMDGLHDAR